MAHFGTKGWFVKQLKEEFNVRNFEGKKLESYRAPVLRNLYNQLNEQKSNKR